MPPNHTAAAAAASHRLLDWHFVRHWLVKHWEKPTAWQECRERGSLDISTCSETVACDERICYTHTNESNIFPPTNWFFWIKWLWAFEILQHFSFIEFRHRDMNLKVPGGSWCKHQDITEILHRLDEDPREVGSFRLCPLCRHSEETGLAVLWDWHFRYQMTQLMCIAEQSARKLAERCFAVALMHIYTQNNHACETIPSHSKIPAPAAKSSAKFLPTTNTHLRPPTRKYGPPQQNPVQSTYWNFYLF